jgi:hypothetical protein
MKPTPSRHRWTWRELATGFMVGAAVFVTFLILIIKGTD